MNVIKLKCLQGGHACRGVHAAFTGMLVTPGEDEGAARTLERPTWPSGGSQRVGSKLESLRRSWGRGTFLNVEKMKKQMSSIQLFGLI